MFIITLFLISDAEAYYSSKKIGFLLDFSKFGSLFTPQPLELFLGIILLVFKYVRISKSSNAQMLNGRTNIFLCIAEAVAAVSVRRSSRPYISPIKIGGVYVRTYQKNYAAEWDPIRIRKFLVKGWSIVLDPSCRYFLVWVQPTTRKTNLKYRVAFLIISIKSCWTPL